MSHEEAGDWIDRLRKIAQSAAEAAEHARERLAHAQAEGDEVLATVLRQHAEAADRAAQDVHVACDQMKDKLPD